MSKNTLDKNILKKVIETTQQIEGYEKASKNIQKEAKDLRKKYGIQVSSAK